MTPHYVLSLCLLSLLWSVAVPQTFLDLMTLAVSGSTIHVSCRMLSYWNASDVFLMISLGS